MAFADDDLPGRVGRVADVGGELFLAPQDKPDQWVAIGLNYPVTSGDNLWVGKDGRAEIDFGAGQFRLAGDTNLHLSQLDDRQFALFVAQGRVNVRVRVLEPGETARIDTPNTQVVLTRPGLYRVDVSEDREHTQLVVREGEANILTAGGVQQVLPGQTAAVDGTDPRFATVRNGVGSDGFDTWAASRDRRYYGRTANYVSPQMVGAADLDQYGTWSQVPEYGAVWYPSDVGADWAPYRNGYWTEVGAWGPTWVDYAPWGYAPFHYGRWAYISGRWGWCPGAYVARPLWAPALVGWAGGSGWSLSATVGAPVYGWVPLGWGEPYRPWWGRCSNGCWNRYNRPYAVNVAVVRPNSPPTRYVNWNAPGGITAVSGSALVMRQPVQANLVRVPGGVAASAPVLAERADRTQRAWPYSDAAGRGRRAAARFHVLSDQCPRGWRAWRHRRSARRCLCRRGANGAHPAHRANDCAAVCAPGAAFCDAGRRAGLRRWRCSHYRPASHPAGAAARESARSREHDRIVPGNAGRAESRAENRPADDGPYDAADAGGRRARSRRRGMRRPKAWQGSSRRRRPPRRGRRRGMRRPKAWQGSSRRRRPPRCRCPTSRTRHPRPTPWQDRRRCSRNPRRRRLKRREWRYRRRRWSGRRQLHRPPRRSRSRHPAAAAPPPQEGGNAIRRGDRGAP